MRQSSLSPLAAQHVQLFDENIDRYENIFIANNMQQKAYALGASGGVGNKKREGMAFLFPKHVLGRM
jgi:hypothetical protein